MKYSHEHYAGRVLNYVYAGLGMYGDVTLVAPNRLRFFSHESCGVFCEFEWISFKGLWQMYRSIFREERMLRKHNQKEF